MSAAVERTVKIGLIAYRDPDGAIRRAQAGTTVRVHPDHVERFDRLNVLPAPPAPAAGVDRDLPLAPFRDGDSDGTDSPDGDGAGTGGEDTGEAPPVTEAKPKAPRTSRAKAAGEDKE